MASIKAFYGGEGKVSVMDYLMDYLSYFVQMTGLFSL